MFDAKAAVANEKKFLAYKQSSGTVHGTIWITEEVAKKYNVRIGSITPFTRLRVQITGRDTLTLSKTGR
jgi:hypothetical protein